MESGLFGWLIINLLLSFVVAKVASDRGRSFAGFFWLSFLLSFLIGLLVALLSPPITASPVEYVDKRMLVKCPKCAEPILAEASVCKHCQRDVEPQLELVAQVHEADRIRAIENRQRAIASMRSTSIAISVFMFLFSAVLLLMGITAFAVSLATGGKIVGAVIVLLGIGLLTWGIIKLRRMPKKEDPEQI